ncbi:MAG: HEAT repeat domain-containing protein [bacterium]
MPSELSPENKADLLRDLKSSDTKRRRYAVRMLSGKADTGEINSFLRKLRPYDWEGRLSAISLLEKNPDGEAVESLKALALDFHPRVRGAARRALKKLGVEKLFSEDEVMELVTYLDHQSWWVKTGAIKSLEALKDPRALDPISHLLLDEDEQVREAAQKAVESLRKCVK